MENNQEVEKRALLPLGQEREVRNKLAELNAKLSSETFVKDIYFCPKNVKTFKEIEMDEVGSYSLRIREEKKNKKSQKSINIKVITNYGDHHSWEEHEITIDSLEETETILNAIGFKPFCKIEKNRQKFDLNGAGIFLEEILGFGLGIEIEILTVKENEDAAKLQIDRLFHKLGIKESQIAPKSITNIIMRKNANF